MKDLGVLVVDEDSAILSLMERMFGYLNVKVDCVTSGVEALRRLNGKAYRTLITNIEMPGMTGLELAHRARELSPELNVILFAGTTSEQVRNLILDSRVSDISEVHSKPSGLGDLLMGIMKQESGRTFLVEDSKFR